MRRVKNVPKTDLNKLAQEVFSRGSQAALPRNLPDRWLRALGRDYVRVQKAELEGRGDEAAEELLGPLLIVSLLMANKQNLNPNDLDMSAEEMTTGLNKFGNAIKEEILGRETGIFLHQYTLENIV